MARVKVIKVYPALLMLSMFAGDLLSSMLWASMARFSVFSVFSAFRYFFLLLLFFGAEANANILLLP